MKSWGHQRQCKAIPVHGPVWMAKHIPLRCTKIMPDGETPSGLISGPPIRYGSWSFSTNSSAWAGGDSKTGCFRKFPVTKSPMLYHDIRFCLSSERGHRAIPNPVRKPPLLFTDSCSSGLGNIPCHQRKDTTRMENALGSWLPYSCSKPSWSFHP